ncbi:MAG: hypothetical protein QM691_05605 [Opitutaceae bacterium]
MKPAFSAAKAATKPPATILERELPPLVRDWAADSALPSEEAKARLNQLFNDEQARVESHWIIARFLAQEHTGASARQLTAFPAIPAALTGEVAACVTPAPRNVAMLCPAIAPRRIPIADVVDMIDAARDLERAAAGRPSLS